MAMPPVEVIQPEKTAELPLKAVLTALRPGLDSSQCKSFVSRAHGNA
jgi:hypothetical protein